MSFSQFSEQRHAVELLQRSLKRSRLGQAYLFGGVDTRELQDVARTLAKTLNCLRPARDPESGQAVDCCDACPSCKRIDERNHPDVYWISPESKMRIITIDQIRELLRVVHLKPTEGAFKVGIITGVDRMRAEAANAFLKTLEEPPANSKFILLTTEAERVLETIVSRCLRLNFAGERLSKLEPEEAQWLGAFATVASERNASLFARYELLGSLLGRLAELKGRIETALTARSPLQKHADVESSLRDKWEDELAAGIESEYRQARSETLLLIQWWLRDVMLLNRGGQEQLLSFPNLHSASQKIAGRITEPEARGNLGAIEKTQRLLFTNVQEALALEVGLLKLRL